MHPPRLAALAFAALAALWTGCATTRVSRSSSPEIAEIERLEDLRPQELSRLGALATSAEPATRARALVALGRIQDPAAIPILQRALADQDASVRDRAAFAAGLIGMSWAPLPETSREGLAAAVVAADADNPKDGARRSFIDAMARLGGPAGTTGLTAIVKGADADDERLQRAILGLALIARREGKMADAPLQAVLSRWKESPKRPRLRYALAYAIAASKSPAVRTQALECLQQAQKPVELREDERQAVALCVRALIESGTEADVPAVQAALDDQDYRVAVEATRALARFAQRAKDNPARASAAVAALGDLSRKVALLAQGHTAGGAQPLLQLAKMEMPAEGQGLLASLRQQLQASLATATGASQLDLARIDCRLAAAQDRFRGAVSEVLSCGSKLPPEAWRLSLALGQIDHGPRSAAPGAAPLASYLTHPSPTVRVSALAAIAAAKDATAKDAVLAMLGDADPLIAGAACGTAAALGDARAIPGILEVAQKAPSTPDLSEPVASALVDLKAPQARELLVGWLSQPHAHLRDVGAKFLEKMGEPLPPAAPRPLAADSPYSPAPDGATLLFTTAKGSFTVKLDTEENPRTSGNLWTLAKKGFFNGLTFHRVEPNFVVQGGDPRGDGDGGPGYSIRCEVTDRRYVRGTIGMALSGKDTGGSQFFFATSEQPHLEGRYTAFGMVTEGDGVLDELMEGEAIAKVTAAP